MTAGGLGDERWEGLNPPYATIVADPPWMYQKDPGAKNEGVGPVSQAESCYSTLTNEQIAGLPVVDLAGDAAHLYLWFFRGQTEHVLFATRGGKHAAIPAEIREPNVIDSRKSGHSQKPPAFFDLVERVSPSPRIELFARQPRLGWDHWGLGIEGVA